MSRTSPRSFVGPRSAALRLGSSPSFGDVGVLVAAVIAIASSALLVRWADAPAVALAFWRTLGGAVLLGLLGQLRRSRRAAESRQIESGERVSRQRLRLLVAGLALAVHFATWFASLEMTSVAASVTLVATAPLMIGVYSTIRGEPLTAMVWGALVVAVAGTAIIAFGDITDAATVVDSANDATGQAVSGGEPLGLSRAIWGDILALIGAASMAVYLVVGAELRTALSTTAYTWRVYGIAAVGLAIYALLTRVSIIGFDQVTWRAIVAITLGPQLVGHTGLNHLLRRLGSLTVSLALLTEPLAATVLVWLVLQEAPPLASVLGAPLITGAIALYLVASNRHRPTEDPKTDREAERPITGTADNRSIR